MEELFYYAFLYLIGLVVSVLILRAVLSINAMLRYFRSQTILLGKIAEKQGIPETEVEQLLVQAGIFDANRRKSQANSRSSNKSI
ncbi:hypothetical protein [Flavobacterium sp.]|uniref:hypothetical protein n=1 Tax=Flavobacterium sp. TaxID=239 RepID=UPI001224C20E|nr:hypothetical protein [Flavobacterium sp.]RZJ69295.1 MAG: hypothetical protein EOO49_17865 [Flavobacterium sp.]